MTYIKFIYKLPSSIASLANKEFVNFVDDRVCGWMNKKDANYLRHCSMYLVSEMETHGKLTVLSNPIGIVARNESDALVTYHAVTGKDNGAVHSEIESNCQSIKVEPTGEVLVV